MNALEALDRLLGDQCGRPGCVVCQLNKDAYDYLRALLTPSEDAKALAYDLMAYVFAPGWKLKEVQARIEAYAAQESSADNADACDAIKNLQQQLEEDQTKSAALQKRVEELEEALSNIGCRTDRGDQPEPCPICAIVDAALKAKE